MAMAALLHSVVYPMDSRWCRIVINAINKGTKNGKLEFFEGANFLDFPSICDLFDRSRIFNVHSLVNAVRSDEQLGAISTRKKVSEAKAAAKQQGLAAIIKSDLFKKAQLITEEEAIQTNRLLLKDEEVPVPITKHKKQKVSLSAAAEPEDEDKDEDDKDEDFKDEDEGDMEVDPTLTSQYLAMEAIKSQYDKCLSELLLSQSRAGRRDCEIIILKGKLERRTTDLTEANEKLLYNNVDPVTSLESQQVFFEESQAEGPGVE